MKIEQYLSRLNEQSQTVFSKSLAFKSQLGKGHHRSCCIHEFALCLPEGSEREVLKTVSSQLESASLNACLGMYRQAFSSLRLALEMGLAAAHFSAHKLDLHEWLDGRKDIKWATLVDKNNGVLSERFANAFFPEFAADVDAYKKRADETYRALSEFVHGNIETWDGTGIELEYKPERLKSFFENSSNIAEIILFVMSCRYLKAFAPAVRESLSFIPEELGHLAYVREYCGGPKEVMYE